MLPDILIKRGGEGVSHVFLQNNGYVLEKNATLWKFLAYLRRNTAL